MAFIAGFECLRARREMEVDRHTEIAVQSIAIQEDIPFESFEPVSLAWINVIPDQDVRRLLKYLFTSKLPAILNNSIVSNCTPLFQFDSNPIQLPSFQFRIKDHMFECSGSFLNDVTASLHRENRQLQNAPSSPHNGISPPTYFKQMHSPQQ
jgi:hypothetical protein